MLLESELFGYERGAFTGAAAARDGKMREAHGGTLFLDEVGELGLCAQAKILRAIETKEIQRLGGHGSAPADFRVVAATNQELESLVATRQFRQDLFFRLNVARIRLTPLREHPEDIPVLLEHYLANFNRKTGQSVQGYSPAALDLLRRYPWPGNVRELRNTVEAMLIVQPWPVVDVRHLPDHVLSMAAACPLEPVDPDRARLMDALRITNWNKSRAARSLHWSRMTLYRKMAKYGIADGVLVS
jgi:DNA-binding NtrC family response regulator